MSARFRVLLVAAAAEVVTLGVLLVNLATVHDPVVARIAGPVHGAVYLVVALVALLSPDLRWGVRLLGLVPVVGGLAAVWRARAGGTAARG
jgi:hypothetical protein